MGEIGIPDRTRHRLLQADARRLPVPTDSVELVVTSPPYPMIEMWDDVFDRLDPGVGTALEQGAAKTAYDRMHEALAPAWAEISRVLAPGGIACINIGDATRSVDGAFQRFPNHARVGEYLAAEGLRSLPGLLWEKPTNGPTKFMGSMRPPNGYVTHEHEHILVYRHGGPRSVDAERRATSAYFWEERNEWFSERWTVTGERQGLEESTRDRAGAFPLEIPYRLINMFSVQGDTVLDPFCGTATTTVAAAASARHSIGCDLAAELLAGASSRQSEAVRYARERGRRRLADHDAFIAERRADGALPEKTAKHYETRVVTDRERGIALPAAENPSGSTADWTVDHRRLKPSDAP
ncbi:MAG: site-specific DNA-methyltransferase [Halodesulfurarchaeum sp.]